MSADSPSSQLFAPLNPENGKDTPSRVESHLQWLESVRPGWAQEISECLASDAREWMEKTIDALAQVGILTEQRDAYAKTLRVIAESNDRSHHETAYAAFIRERHPELEEGAL